MLAVLFVVPVARLARPPAFSCGPLPAEVLALRLRVHGQALTRGRFLVELQIVIRRVRERWIPAVQIVQALSVLVTRLIGRDERLAG